MQTQILSICHKDFIEVVQNGHQIYIATIKREINHRRYMQVHMCIVVPPLSRYLET